MKIFNRWIIMFLIVLLPAVLFAQGYKKRSSQGTDAKIQLQIEQGAIGFGSFFDNENITFSMDALFVGLQWHGVGFPGLVEGTSTGIGFEFHPGVLLEENGMRLLGTVDWRMWSLSRVPISAIPIKALQSGTLSHVFMGTDILIEESGGHDFTGDFEARLVIGGDLGQVGPGSFVLELYFFEQTKPVAFAVNYGL